MKHLHQARMDGTIRIYSLQPNGLYRYKAELIGHTAAIISLAKLNNNIFISSSRDKTIRIWKKILMDCMRANRYFTIQQTLSTQLFV
jgi:WD40 repeat protein